MGFSLVFQGKGGNNGAGNGDRTRDPRLGKPMLYQLSYARTIRLAKSIKTNEECQGNFRVYWVS